jgi:hypothetical protein
LILASSQCISFIRKRPYTHSSHPKIAKNTSALATHYAPVLDLGEACVAVHLRELELGLGAHALRERGIADDVAERLSRWVTVSAMRLSLLPWWTVDSSRRIPFGLVLGVDLALRVVANVTDVGKAADVKFLRAELGHDGGGQVGAMQNVVRSCRWFREVEMRGPAPYRRDFVDTEQRADSAPLRIPSSPASEQITLPAFENAIISWYRPFVYHIIDDASGESNYDQPLPSPSVLTRSHGPLHAAQLNFPTPLRALVHTPT